MIPYLVQVLQLTETVFCRTWKAPLHTETSIKNSRGNQNGSRGICLMAWFNYTLAEYVLWLQKGQFYLLAMTGTVQVILCKMRPFALFNLHFLSGKLRPAATTYRYNGVLSMHQCWLRSTRPNSIRRSHPSRPHYVKNMRFLVPGPIHIDLSRNIKAMEYIQVSQTYVQIIDSPTHHISRTVLNFFSLNWNKQNRPKFLLPSKGVSPLQLYFVITHHKRHSLCFIHESAIIFS